MKVIDVIKNLTDLIDVARTNLNYGYYNDVYADIDDIEELVNKLLYGINSELMELEV